MVLAPRDFVSGSGLRCVKQSRRYQVICRSTSQSKLPLLTCLVPKSKPQIGIEAEQSFLFCPKKICLKRRRSSQIRAPLGSFFVASVVSVEVVVLERQVQRQRSFLVVAWH